MEKSPTQKQIPFKFKIPTNEITRKISSEETLNIVEFLKGSKYIVSPRDIGALYKDGASSEVYKISDSEIASMLRKATDNNGVAVYKDAEIKVEQHDPKNIYGIQTFVSHSKLLESTKRDSFFKNLGISASYNGSSYIIKTGYNMKYASIFIPPIVLDYKSEGFQEPIKLAEYRIKNNDPIIINGLSGPMKFDMEAALTQIKKEVSKNDVVPVVKDGTHRSYASYAAGSKLSAITIRNQNEMPTNIPIDFDLMVIAAQKPETRDRYPGYVPNAIAELKRLGIDS